MGARIGFLSCLLVLGSVALAGEADKATSKGPLAGLPGKPGAHAARLKALGEGQWLNLGKPRPDPKWGPGWGRSYTPKMAYAADIEGAFLNGQGVHGFVKKKYGRVMDDSWFYDVNAHAWVCCYPGTPLATVDTDWKVDKRGFLVSKDGESPQMTGIVHGYNSISYSPKLRKFITWHGVGYTNKKIAAMWKKKFPDKAARKNYHNRQYPYFYDVGTGRWSRHKTSRGPGSFSIYGVTCEWLPTKNVFCLYRFRSDLWFYDPLKKEWKNVKPAGPGPSGGYEGVSCYDTKRQRLCIFNNKDAKFGIYDVAANKWLAPKDKFSPGADSGRSYHTTKSSVNYDAANDVVVLFHEGKTEKGAYVYDPGKDKWLNQDPLPDSRRKGMSGFYCPKYNAHYFFNAGDSRTTPGEMWVWRYKKPKKQ